MRLARLVIAGMAVMAAASAAVASGDAVLTPDGWGAYRIGMSEAALAELGVKIPPEDEVNTVACRQMRAPGAEDLLLMTENGRLTRLSIGQDSAVRTDRGLGVGAGEGAVREAYGAAIVATPHKYQDPPAAYLTFRTAPGGNGVRYEINEDRRVGMIHVGGPSIEYVEGCL